MKRNVDFFFFIQEIHSYTSFLTFDILKRKLYTNNVYDKLLTVQITSFKIFINLRNTLLKMYV